MAYDLEEQEKLDAIKAWWARYGTVVISLVAAVALAWGGWWSWKAYESHRANQAMSYFEALEDAARLGTADSVVRIKTAAATLREQYGSTGYPRRAGGGPGPADPEGYGRRARAARMAGRPEQEPVHAIRRAPAPGGSAA